MDSFSRVEQSDKKFNIIFSVSVSVVVSVFIIGLITYLGFAKVPYCWVAYSVLVFLPVVVYAIARTQSTSYKMAYYKKWVDKFLGVLDRRVILKDFMQKYEIDSLKTKVKDVKADGRWRFKVSTSHVRGLITEKNTILLHLENDRIHAEKLLDVIIEKQQKILKDEEADEEKLQTKKRILDNLLEEAKTAGEIFKQRRDLEEVQKKLNDAKKRLNDATYELNVAKKEKDEAIKSFENAEKRTKDYYYLRYQNYTSLAIKKINEINGLKYKIDDMVEDK